MTFVLAWRNVWRNRRRSLITLASIAAGLASIMFGQSLIKSIQLQLVEKATGIIIGHLRVMSRQVQDMKVPDKKIPDPDVIGAALDKEPGIEVWGKRILFTGLLSTAAGSKGVLVCAVEPNKERRIIAIPKYMTEGTFLGPAPGRGRPEKGLVIGDRLARDLDLKLGEKAVLMSQATDGSLGAEAFRVAGIYHTGSQTFDGQIAYVPLTTAQEMLVMGNQVNDFIARVKRLPELGAIQARLAEVLKGRRDIQVLTWREVDREIVGIQKYQNALLLIVLFIVFAIVALGILNTMLMSLFERVREFGVLMAIGAKPRLILRMILLEALILGMLGMLAGVAIGSALIAWYGRAGLPLPIGEAIAYFMPFDTVVYTRFAWERHWVALVVVFATCLLASLVPALRAARLRPAEALRHV